MGGRTLTQEDPAKGKALLSGLVEFCWDSLSNCFSRDAHKLCVPVGLSCASALLLLLSCFLLLYQRCRFRRDSPGETVTFLYSLLGNVCSTVGAVLSGQLRILVLMGAVAAAVDFVHFVSCCLPVLLCWNTKAERLRMMRRRRRRKHLLAVCVLMVVAGGFLKSRINPLQTADWPLIRRRLLHVTLQDNTEILGYILGLLSFVISCTSRFPALCRAYRGQMFTRAHVFSGLLCTLAGALYAAALLLYDNQLGFLLRVLPWLLSAMCCVILEPLILVVYWCKRGSRQQLITSFSPDTERLLGGSSIHTTDEDDMKRKQQVHSLAPKKTKNAQKMTEMGRYMDVSVHPARKIFLKEIMSKKEEEGQVLDGTVRVISRVDSFCSSDTSYDSSRVSSDLEWDFEEANARWSKPRAKQQEGGGSALQGWPTKPGPRNICTSPTSGLPQKTLSGAEVGERVSPESLSK